MVSRCPIKAAIRPLLESLESRRLLSAELLIDTLVSPTFILAGNSNEYDGAVDYNPVAKRGVAVWTQDGADADISFRGFDGNGAFTSAPTIPNSGEAGYQNQAEVAVFNDGGFVIVWRDDSLGNGQIIGERFNANGTANGASFVIADDTFSHEYPRVATAGDSGFVVAYTSRNQDGAQNGIYARRFDGVSLGNEFIVNTVTTSDQERADVACYTDGSFDIVFHGHGYDSDDLAVVLQRYDAAGNTLGGNVVVNTDETDAQGSPRIDFAADGSAVIAYDSPTIDGDSYGIVFRRIAADGTLLGTGTLVNTTTVGAQHIPDVVVNDDGAFTVVWHNDPDETVRARSYDPAGNAITDETTLFTSTSSIMPVSAVDLGQRRFAAIGEAGSHGGDVTFFAGHNILHIDGDTSNNTIAISNNAGSVQANIDGVITIHGAQFEWMEVSGDDGNDNVSILSLPSGAGSIRIHGDAGNDTISGSSANETIYGDGGNDRLLGRGGNDRLSGDDGDNLLFGNNGRDRLIGGNGADALNAGGGPDIVYALDGNDTIYGGAGRDRLFAGAGDDRVKGGRNDDTIHGEAGNDRLYGDSGDDDLNGNDGDDHLFGGNGADQFYGGIGYDKSFGQAGADFFNTDNGIDRIDGGKDIDSSIKDLLDKLLRVESIV